MTTGYTARLDKILPHKQELERHLKDRLGTLFELDYELLLYDRYQHVFRGPGKRQRTGQTGLFHAITAATASRFVSAWS